MNMMIFGIGAVIVFLSVIVSVIILVTVQQRRKTAKYSELAAKLNATCRGRVITGNSVPFTLTHNPGSKNSPPSLVISLYMPSCGEFLITRESKIEAAAKHIGLSVEIATGDPDFDRDFYIDTATTELTQAWLGSRDVRGAIRNIFTFGVKSIQLKNNHFLVTLLQPELDRYLTEPVIENLLTELNVLSSKLPAVRESDAVSREFRDWKSRVFSLIGSVVALEAIGIVLLVIGVFRYPPLDSQLYWVSLIYSVPVAGILLLAGFKLIAGHSRSHVYMILFMTVAVSACVLSGIGASLCGNGYFDDTAPAFHRVRVNDTYEVSGDDSTSYYMVTTSWREGKDGEKISISHDDYRSIKVGDDVTVATKPGKLGYEWLVSYRVTD